MTLFYAAISGELVGGWYACRVTFWQRMISILNHIAGYLFDAGGYAWRLARRRRKR
jgi:hypothetical protein